MKEVELDLKDRKYQNDRRQIEKRKKAKKARAMLEKTVAGLHPNPGDIQRVKTWLEWWTRARA